jgi:flagellar protein FliO/FliZ
MAGLSAQSQESSGVPGIGDQTAAPENSNGLSIPAENTLLLGEIPAEDSLLLGDTGSPASGVSSPFVIIQMVLVLALAAAAIYGIVFLLKRVSRPREAPHPHLKVLASAPLGTNRFVHVVSVGSRAWLVGAADNSVSLISELEEQEVVDAMLLEDSRKNAESPAGKFPDFKSLLRRMGGGGPENQNRSPDSLRKRRERLKGL